LDNSEEQQEESEQPEISEELAQPQQIMSNPPVLQTPLNEERNLKRDREEATPSSRPIDQTFAKRQRLNPMQKKNTLRRPQATQWQKGQIVCKLSQQVGHHLLHIYKHWKDNKAQRCLLSGSL
jgi:type II secretory pathway component PulJ